ncbi:hypothetical protein [Streptomyces sp. Y1]|uniref:Uncharacterized protein n=1 Tax=Streptomyces sp. Y1 TaxID=3238634 RepID=A0AB39TX72_9ACTN
MVGFVGIGLSVLVMVEAVTKLDPKRPVGQSGPCRLPELLPCGRS